jgi:23S rRNA (uracil1939-C5)-methyltransferase
MKKTFSETLDAEVRTANRGPLRLTADECHTSTGTLCRLCLASTIDYPHEVKSKERALTQFWIDQNLGHGRAPLVPSAEGRQYRSVSKRKVFWRGRNIVLGLIDPDQEHGRQALDVITCGIEPPSHALLYGRIGTWLKRPSAIPLQESLRYVIVKGSPDAHIVILNVTSIERETVRTANALSKFVTSVDKKVTGFFLYEDRSGGQYYLGSTRGGGTGRLQRLFGTGTLSHRTAGKRFLFSPLAFTQVHQGMLETLVDTVARLLMMPMEGTLFDLYAGYGLFGLSLAGQARAVVAIELSPVAVKSGIDNLRNLHLHNVRFHRSDLNGSTLEPFLRAAGVQDRVILDPPRGGTAEGVIEVVASRRCARIVHLFCNIDIMPAELARWKRAGYRLEQAVPLDMFPGTASVEIAALLVPEDPDPGRKGKQRSQQ